MAKFTLEFIPDNIVLKDFIIKTRERAKTNPFIIDIEHIKEGVYSFDITPVYPKIYWLGIIIFIIISLLGLLFGFPSNIFLSILIYLAWAISLLLMASLFFWTKFPYLWGIKKGLKKIDYSGSIKESGTNRSI